MSPNCDAVVCGLNATEGDDAVLMSATRPDGVGAAPAAMSLTEDHVGTSGERVGVCTDTLSDGDSAADAIDDVPGGPTDESATGATACSWNAVWYRARSSARASLAAVSRRCFSAARRAAARSTATSC